jgi:tetratricopeptide (TPR) repeat protein
VDELLRQDGKSADAHVIRGQILLAQGKRDEALAAFRQAVSLDPSSAEAQFTLGRTLALRGDDSAAKAAFEETLRINPRAAAAQAQIARLQVRAGQPQDAVRSAEAATRADPKALAAGLALVQSLAAAGETARAERELQGLLKDHPQAAAVHQQAGRLAILKRDLPAARAALQRAEALEPGALGTFEAWLDLDLARNDAAAVKARLDERLRQDRTPATLLLASRTYLTIKDPASAETTLRAAIDADPSLAMPYGMLGQLYYNQNRLDQALGAFEASAARDTDPVPALTMTGMILVQQGKREAARKRYEEVLAINPEAAVAANNVAWMLADAGEDLDRALQLALTAAASLPDTPEIMDSLGWVYYKRHEARLAIAQFERCVQKAPRIPEYHHHLGLAYVQAGDLVRGRASLQRALDRGIDASTAADIRRTLEGLQASR